MARIKKLIFAVLLSSFCSACSFNNQSPELQQEPFAIAPHPSETVNFFSRMHTGLRNTERAIHDFMYGVRDGFDRFIYDSQKDYYENYQK